MRKRALIAAFAGSLLSIVLMLVSSAVSHVQARPPVLEYFLFYSQVIGWWVCIATRGIHAATLIDWWEVAVPVDAALYAVLIFGVMQLRALRKRSS